MHQKCANGPGFEQALIQVCFQLGGPMWQKEKREPGSRALGRVFSKLNCTKGITKVKGDFRSAHGCGRHTSQNTSNAHQTVFSVRDR